MTHISLTHSGLGQVTTPAARRRCRHILVAQWTPAIRIAVAAGHRLAVWLECVNIVDVLVHDLRAAVAAHVVGLAVAFVCRDGWRK